jgi:uncharacterized membrane protein YfcA
MSAAWVAAGLGIFAGAAVQSATGFGFSLVLAPLAFAAVDHPAQAVWLSGLLSLLVNVLTLATERRRAEPIREEAAWILAWSVPGALLGVWVLRALSAAALQILVSGVVVASLLTRRRPARTTGQAPSSYAPGWRRPAAGVALGALNTSVGPGGPPVVLYLLGRGLAPARMRDTLGAIFLASGVVGVAILAATQTGPLPPSTALAAGVPLAVAGHLAGRPLFRRLERHGYEAALALVLVASVLGGTLRALG